MSEIDVLEQFKGAKRKAYDAARRLLPNGMVGDVSSIVNSARLAVIERTLAVISAAASNYVGTDEQKVYAELRDYWEEVVEEISG